MRDISAVDDLFGVFLHVCIAFFFKPLKFPVTFWLGVSNGKKSVWTTWGSPSEKLKCEVLLVYAAVEMGGAAVTRCNVSRRGYDEYMSGIFVGVNGEGSVGISYSELYSV